ncbi:MAG: FtsX-like permease family protein [Planctomyces sp.]
MTSIRIAPSGALLNEEQLQTLSSRLSADILKAINPVDAGLGFRPIRAEGLRASSGANDFTQLFLGFSFFLILSAILLASLMFRLGIQRRLSQAGLLGALGFPERRILWFFLSEGLLVSLGGCIVGMFAAVGFAQLMIHGLTTWWIGAIGTTFLHPDVQPLKLIIAAMISLAMSIAVIHRSLTLSTRRTVRDLLSGSQDSENVDRRSGTLRRTVGGLMFPATLLVAVGLPWALIAGVIPSGEAFGGMSWRIVCFFLSGFSWLACGLLFLSRTLKKRNKEILETSPINGIFSLAMANAARRPERSLLTTALIAFATFVIVAVGAGRRNPVTELPDIRSGNGGFTLVAESSQPILGDLNSTEGREKLGLNRDPATTLPQKTYVYGFSMKPGQDASCLNLYQATVPTLLGATPEFMRRGGFRFADTPGAEPWKNIEQVLPDENGRPVIPVIGDMNTLQFSLKKGIGGTIAGPDPENPEFYLKIVGMLDSSIFQGVLVCSDSNLKRIAPEVFGQRYFLAETPSDSATIRKAAEALETALSSWGVDTEPVNQRLASFLAVQNTYLSTFQILGGLGLLVGTFGLTVVMMRNVMERRREIALMKALGFRTIRIIRLILTENCVLLFWGIVTGSASALIAMLPHLLSTGADVPWVELAITLGIVALAGTLASAFPVRAAAGTSIRENLAAG